MATVHVTCIKAKPDELHMQDENDQTGQSDQRNGIRKIETVEQKNGKMR